MKRPLTIFVPHCSDLLTDHLPHGDGLIAHGFLSHLADRGHRIHVVAQETDLRGPLGSNVTIHRIPAERAGNMIWRPAYMRRLRRLFWQLKEQIQFDLIHQLNPVFTGLSLALAGSGLPLVLGTYVARWPADASSDTPASWKDRAVARCRDAISALQQRQADALVLTTPAASNRLPSPGRVRDRVYFLPHGVDTKLFSPAGPAPADEFPKQRPNPSILFFANVVKRKGIFTLIDAFPAIANDLPNVRLRIAGDGPDLAEVKKRVVNLRCADQVEFLGRQERANAPVLYRDCGVYCLPSFGEPYGGTLVEAMSCGKAVVATDCGGPPHILTDKGGILVPPGDAPALARALGDLLRDPERRAAMGLYNRRVAESTMSWESVVVRLEDIYQTTIAKHGAGRTDDRRLAIAEGQA